MNIITYEGIRAVSRTERLEPLSKLPDGFWVAVRGWLASKEEKKDSISLLELESAKKLLEDVIARRQRKIIFGALGSTRGSPPPTNMTPDEQEFFEESLKLLKQNKENALEKYISASATAEQKLEEARESIEAIKTAMTTVIPVEKPVFREEIQATAEPLKAFNGTRMIKIKNDLQKFVGADMNEYGPFKAGDVVKLPSEIRSVLVARNAAEIVLE